MKASCTLACLSAKQFCLLVPHDLTLGTTDTSTKCRPEYPHCSRSRRGLSRVCSTRERVVCVCLCLCWQWDSNPMSSDRYVALWQTLHDRGLHLIRYWCQTPTHITFIPTNMQYIYFFFLPRENSIISIFLYNSLLEKYDSENTFGNGNYVILNVITQREIWGGYLSFCCCGSLFSLKEVGLHKAEDEVKLGGSAHMQIHTHVG